MHAAATGCIVCYFHSQIVVHSSNNLLQGFHNLVVNVTFSVLRVHSELGSTLDTVWSYVRLTPSSYSQFKKKSNAYSLC